MKKLLVVLLAIIVISGIQHETVKAKTDKEALKGTVILSGAWALYPMTVRWAEEFRKIHPEVRIDIAAGGAGKGMADCLAGIVDIGMVSREIYPEEIKKGAWWVSVTKDAVVATINKKNPVGRKLLSKGARRKDLMDVWVTGKVKKWGEITGDEKFYRINVYTRSDACGAAGTWAKYLGKNQEDLLGIGVYGDPGLAEAVRNDVLGIGFNNINYVYDAKTKEQIDGIQVLPIDLNNNGQIDNDENFYGNRDGLASAISSGKYPSPPARDLHFVSRGKPAEKVVLDFLKWVLTDGQKYVPESGYIKLPERKLREELKKLETE